MTHRQRKTSVQTGRETKRTGDRPTVPGFRLEHPPKKGETEKKSWDKKKKNGEERVRIN